LKATRQRPRTIPGKAISKELAKARLKNIKSEEERQQVMWELEEMSRLASRKRVAVSSLPPTTGRGRGIRLALLKPHHRGFQYVGQARGFRITLNAYPLAHKGSKNAARSGESSTDFPLLSKLAIWSEVNEDLHMMTHVQWDSGHEVFDTRYIQSILVKNKDGENVTVPRYACWYVRDESGKIIKYE
jgi:hypothetical protein